MSLNQFDQVRLYYSPETVYCLLLSRMARMEIDFSLKKLVNTFKFSLWTDRVFGPESNLDRSFHKNLTQIFFSCSKKYITHKANKELHLWSFDDKTAKVPWHSPFNKERQKKSGKRKYGAHSVNGNRWFLWSNMQICCTLVASYLYFRMSSPA